MASKKMPPAMMLFADELDDIFSGDYTSDEVGELMITAWSCFRGRSTPEEYDFGTRDMKSAFKAIIRSMNNGMKMYDKKVTDGGLGGIMARLANLEGQDMITVKTLVEQLRADGHTDEEITSRLKNDYKIIKKNLTTPSTAAAGRAAQRGNEQSEYGTTSAADALNSFRRKTGY